MRDAGFDRAQGRIFRNILHTSMLSMPSCLRAVIQKIKAAHLLRRRLAASLVYFLLFILVIISQNSLLRAAYAVVSESCKPGRELTVVFNPLLYLLHSSSSAKRKSSPSSRICEGRLAVLNDCEDGITISVGLSQPCFRLGVAVLLQNKR